MYNIQMYSIEKSYIAGFIFALVIPVTTITLDCVVIGDQ
jgi:hypothetical protein